MGLKYLEWPKVIYVIRKLSPVASKQKETYKPHFQGSLFSFDTVDKLVVVENFLNLERSYVDKLKLLVEVSSFIPKCLIIKKYLHRPFQL